MTPVIATSCFSYPRYPDEWAKIQDIQTSDCPHIAGQYNNKADVPQSSFTSYRALGDLLKYLNSPKLDPLSHVEINQASNTKIEVKAWNQDELVWSKEFNRDEGDFKCESGMILFPSVSKTEFDSFAIARTSATLSLGMSIDGSLVVKQEGSTIGAIILIIPIIPAYGSGIEWYRFTPLINEKPNNLMEGMWNSGDLFISYGLPQY